MIVVMYDGQSDGEPEALKMGHSTTAPTGIRVLCYLGVLGALLGILGGLGAMDAEQVSSSFGLGVVGLSVPLLVVYWGLLNLKSWAWTAYVVLGGLSTAYYAFLFVDGAVAAGVQAGLNGLLLAYVFSKRDRYHASTYESVS